jgi:hypothetical protein
MTDYLRLSRTWPAVVTSTLGLVDDPKKIGQMLRPGPGNLVTYNGKPMSFTPGAAMRDDLIGQGVLSSQTIAHSLYMKGLVDCYAPNMVPFNQNPESFHSQDIQQSFMAPMDLNQVSDPLIRMRGLPEVHWGNTTAMTDWDGELVRYMIGAGECRWSAVAMATNAARIMTGRAILPTISGVTPKAASPMPAPLSDTAWREKNLLAPLFNITTLGSDGDEVRAMAARAGYRIAMKTGTIDDGRKEGARESEMLMFTIGRYDAATGFQPDHSVSGFLSIRSSKLADGEDMVKGELVKKLMPIVIRHLKRIESSHASKK